MEKHLMAENRGGYDTKAPLRGSNLELYRIICMLLIVAHHSVVNSGVLESMYANPLSSNSIFLFLFGAWGKTGINCFTFITGYFLCKSTTSLKSYAKLAFQLLFYNFFVAVIFMIAGIGSVKDLIMFPILVRNVDSSHYFACFLVFYLFIPFINIFLKSINRKQHLYIIGLFSFLYIFLGTVPKFNVVMNYVSWFTVIYIIAAYVRFYPPKFNKWGLLSVISIVMSCLSVVAMVWVGAKFDKQIAFKFVSDSNTFLAFATGFTTFMFFKDLKIKSSRIINAIGASTFGVLCIHANSWTMINWLWKDLLDIKGAYNMPTINLIIYMVVSIIGIFIVCSLIDTARGLILEKPFIGWLQKMELYKKADSIFAVEKLGD